MRPPFFISFNNVTTKFQNLEISGGCIGENVDDIAVHGSVYCSAVAGSTVIFDDCHVHRNNAQVQRVVLLGVEVVGCLLVCVF